MAWTRRQFEYPRPALMRRKGCGGGARLSPRPAAIQHLGLPFNAGRPSAAHKLSKDDSLRLARCSFAFRPFYATSMVTATTTGRVAGIRNTVTGVRWRRGSCDGVLEAERPVDIGLKGPVDGDEGVLVEQRRPIRRLNEQRECVPVPDYRAGNLVSVKTAHSDDDALSDQGAEETLLVENRPKTADRDART